MDRHRDLKRIMEFCPFLLRLVRVLTSALLDKLNSLGFAVHIIDDRKGVLPAEAVNMPSLVDDLLKRESYVNLFCSRAQ